MRYYIGGKREYDLDLSRVVAFLSLILEEVWIIQEQSPIEKLLSGKTLGQKIMYLRKLRGFTKRQDFVNAVNEGSYGYIWEIEAGIVTNIPDHILKRIADVLQIPIDFLQE